MFDGSHPQAKKILPLAKNAAKKLKTIRHPHILKFIDDFETDSCVYLATERVRPLAMVLDEEKFASMVQKEQWLTWGLERTTVCQSSPQFMA
jgi:SCY1-like protein 1